MFCPKCGTQNPDDGRFCRSCGADLGNVSAALSGKLPKPHNLVDRKGRAVSWQSAITNIFMGFAFFTVSAILGISGAYGGENWWFWLLIPAFGCLGSGIAQMVQLRKVEKQEAALAPQNTQNTLSSAPQNNALPPTQTDYVAPPAQSIYETGELQERPGSVTEGTTRHLQMDSEGETMTLPKK